jgi:hypothetical protein
MKKYLFLFLLFFCFQSINAQVKLRPELSIAYLQHSKLAGLGITNGLHFPLNEKSKLVASFTFAYGHGNRNFDPDKEGLYNIEYADYSPRFQALQGIPFLWDYPYETEVKTSTTFQYSLNLSYVKKVKDWEFGGGLYFTFLNKSYLAALIPDFDISFGNVPFSIDYLVPFHIRYYDAGPFLTATRRINGKKAKLPVYATSAIYLALKNNHSYYLGLAIDL